MHCLRGLLGVVLVLNKEQGKKFLTTKDPISHDCSPARGLHVAL